MFYIDDLLNSKNEIFFFIYVYHFCFTNYLLQEQDKAKSNRYCQRDISSNNKYRKIGFIVERKFGDYLLEQYDLVV